MKIFCLLGLLICVVIVVDAQVKKPIPPAVKVPFAESLQAVVVTTESWSAAQGTARLFERKTRGAKWKPIGESFPVVVGRNGLAWSLDSAPETAGEVKREGDGKSPAGLFPISFAFGSSTKPEQLGFPYTKLERWTECVDDPSSTHYNKIVNRMQVGNFDWKSSEKMLEVGEQYDLGIFVAYNSYPVRSGYGSCIFLHVWKDEATGTSGCTAMDRTYLERLVGWLETAKKPYLVQLTKDTYKTYRKSWNLPNL